MSTVSTFLKDAQEDLAGRVVVAENQLDFSATNVSAGDVVQVLTIPKGGFVTRVMTRVKTAEGAAATTTVGDGAGAASWDATVNLNSAATVSSTNGTDAYAVGKLYTASDTIDLVVQDSLDTAVVEVYVEYSVQDRYDAS